MTSFSTRLKWATAPFYMDGRRFLKLSGKEIDRLLAAGARASFASGTVTITAPGGGRTYAKARIASSSRSADWVNDFNDRSNSGAPAAHR